MHNEGAARREPRPTNGSASRAGWCVLREYGRIARVRIGVRGLEGTTDWAGHELRRGARMEFELAGQVRGVPPPKRVKITKRTRALRGLEICKSLIDNQL